MSTLKGEALKKRKTITTGYMAAKVREYLDRPDILSSDQQRRIREAFYSRSYDSQDIEMGQILDQMCFDDEMSQLFEDFSPHVKCRVSLVRDVLMELWTKSSTTQPTKVEVAA